MQLHAEFDSENDGLDRLTGVPHAKECVDPEGAALVAEREGNLLARPGLVVIPLVAEEVGTPAIGVEEEQSEEHRLDADDETGNANVEVRVGHGRSWV